MIDATLVDSHVFRTAGYLASYKFTVPSILAGVVSDEIRFALPFAGVLKSFRIECNSIDFDISIRTEAGITPPSISEILKVIDINQRYDEQGLDIVFITPAEEEYLYGVVTNSDLVNATGILTIEVIVGKM